MSSWEELINFVRNRYEIIDSKPDELRILLGFADDDRTQVVIVRREVMDDAEWVQLASPFALASEVDLAEALRFVAQGTVVGGVVINGQYAFIRHSLPLATLDLAEFTVPLGKIADIADGLEKHFSGTDKF
jgi:hypothetical protein